MEDYYTINPATGRVVKGKKAPKVRLTKRERMFFKTLWEKPTKRKKRKTK